MIKFSLKRNEITAALTDNQAQPYLFPHHFFFHLLVAKFSIQQLWKDGWVFPTIKKGLRYLDKG